MNPENAQYWIEHLELKPHPEGGYYKEVFRSQQQVIRANASDSRSACTSIYYLLEGNDFSGFHRLLSDELWYFHKGMPLLVHVINEKGNYSKLELSDNVSGNLSIVIPAGSWFASEIPSKSAFALVSCAVAPGFEFDEFEMAKKDELIALYSTHAEILNRLCRD